MSKGWKQVKAPTTWRPQPGDWISGRYCGRTKKDGMYGQYEVVIVLTDEGEAVTIGGYMLIQLVDISLLSIGDEIRVQFIEHKALASDRTIKVFDLYIRAEHVVMDEKHLAGVTQ